MISNVYSYYLTQYSGRQIAKHQAHKPGELRNTYMKMLMINKSSPFYKIDVSEEAQRYAIDLKENARELTNIANDLSSPGSDSSAMELKKSAVSSNADLVDAEYVGDNNSPPVSSFDIEVKQLASSQINIGNYLQPGSKHLSSGEHSFDLAISGLTYEFSFNVDDSDTTKTTQEKIARLINRSNIGLKSSVITDSLDNSAISIESESTGISGTKPTIFSISDSFDNTNPLTEMLGLNRVAHYPANAIFSIDGNESSSASNSVSINKSFQLTLKGTTETPVTISLKEDSDAIKDSISQLVDGYNRLISVASDNSNDRFIGNSRLRNEFKSLSGIYSELLKSSGLDIQDDGSINISNDTIDSASEESRINEIFSNLGIFKNAIQAKAETISLNPMKYVNNTIVAYKNPKRSLIDPYNSSIYSGMMFNDYC